MSYLLQLQSLVNNLDNQQTLENELVKNIDKVFQTPSIYAFYNLLKGFVFDRDEANVILGWLAILSGDNLSLMKIIKRVNEEQMSSEFTSLYYDLLALSSLSGRPEERLLYNDKALALVQENKDTFFYANVHLTRGQIFAGLRQYRNAADCFHEAYQSFFAADMLFPAAVAMTNALLNWHKIGEFKQVINQANKVLLMMSQYQTDGEPFWDIIKLPLGMTYFVQFKVDLAKEYLEASLQVIDQMNLIHMHGYSELYLMELYQYQHATTDLLSLYNKTEELYENMHYPFMRIILIYGKIVLEKTITASDIQFVETFYEQTKGTGEPLVVAVLFYLSMQEDRSILHLDQIEQVIADLRYQGDLTNLGTMLLLLSEYYYKTNQIDDMYIILEEVVQLYHESDIQSVFYRFPLTNWKHIHQLDDSIKQNISKKSLLTPKEQEVMRYIEMGYTNKQIAETIFVSVGTVKWHINNIYSKLNVASRIEAVNAIKQKT